MKGEQGRKKVKTGRRKMGIVWKWFNKIAAFLAPFYIGLHKIIHYLSKLAS